MNIEIRHAELDDHEALTKLHAQPNVIWGTCQLPLPSPDSWKKRLSELGDNVRLLVACVDGEIVGALSLMTFKAPRRRHAADLGMAVHDDWQGKGVGSALMRACIDKAESGGHDSVWLGVWQSNSRAVAFYQKWGFRIVGVQTFAVGDDVQPDHIMEREIG